MGFIIITRIQNRRAQRLGIDQIMRNPHTPRGDTHHRHMIIPRFQDAVENHEIAMQTTPADKHTAENQQSSPGANDERKENPKGSSKTSLAPYHELDLDGQRARPPVHTSITAQQPPPMVSAQGVAPAIPECRSIQQQIIIVDCATVCSRNPASAATSASNADLGRCQTSYGSGGSSVPRSSRRPSGCCAS